MSLLPTMPAAWMVAMKLVEHAMIEEKEGISGSNSASKISSRAMLESVGSGITCPQRRKSGFARAAIASAIGAESCNAVNPQTRCPL